jgi:transcriptional regulator with XRE-family HTH domain
VSRFGQTLRQHRQSRKLSLRKLAGLTTFGFTFLSQVERGERKPTEKLARLCDKALDADGALIEIYLDEQTGKKDMDRRTVIRALGALAASPLPLVQWEALRQSMEAAVDPDFDRWDQVVEDYGIAYYCLPGDQVMDNLRADLTVLHTIIPTADDAARAHLLRAASRLSVIVALNLVTVGQTLAAGRWWRDAQKYATGSRDKETIVLARAWDVVNGCYDGRSASWIVDFADQVLPLTAGMASAGSCGLLAGRAQALSLAGRHDEAVDTAGQLAETAERLPRDVINDADSLWGWPEHRLRHTEAWVYAHAGRLSEATRAQERAIALYPPGMTRLRAQVQLHHAAAMIRQGQIPDGLQLAADLINELPAEDQNELVRTVARQVMAAVPSRERGRTAYHELRDCIAPRRTEK